MWGGLRNRLKSLFLPCLVVGRLLHVPPPRGLQTGFLTAQRVLTSVISCFFHYFKHPCSLLPAWMPLKASSRSGFTIWRRYFFFHLQPCVTLFSGVTIGIVGSWRVWLLLEILKASTMQKLNTYGNFCLFFVFKLYSVPGQNCYSLHEFFEFVDRTLYLLSCRIFFPQMPKANSRGIYISLHQSPVRKWLSRSLHLTVHSYAHLSCRLCRGSNMIKNSHAEIFFQL